MEHVLVVVLLGGGRDDGRLWGYVKMYGPLEELCWVP